MNRDIRLAIVDPLDVSRLGLQVLAEKCDISIVGLYSDPEVCFSTIAQARPTHLLVNDAIQPPQTVFSVITRSLGLVVDLRVAVLTRQLRLRFHQELFKLDVRAVLHEFDNLDDTLELALRTLAKGLPFISPSVLAIQLASPRRVAGMDYFSRIVLQGTLNGWTVQQIAQNYSVSDRTVYRVRQELRKHFGAQTTDELVSKANEEGWGNPQVS